MDLPSGEKAGEPLASACGDTFRKAAALGGDDEDVGVSAAVVRLAGTVRGKRHPLRIGRPRRVRIVEIALGQLTGGTRCDLHDEDVRALIPEQATPVLCEVQVSYDGHARSGSAGSRRRLVLDIAAKRRPSGDHTKPTMPESSVVMRVAAPPVAGAT